MTKIEITCGTCSQKALKPRKEYDRQIKHGRMTFYCSRRCSGFNARKNLPDPTANPWNHDPEHLRLMQDKAIVAKTRYTKEQRPFHWILRNTLKRTQHQNDLDVVFLQELWKHQNGRCAISNIPLVMDGKDYGTKASLDRIDCKLGYVRGNVQYVSYALNLAKRDSSDDEVHSLIELIFEYYPKKPLASDRAVA